MKNTLQIIKDNARSDNNLLSIDVVDNAYDYLVGPDFFNNSNFESISGVPVSDIGIIAELFTGAHRIINSGKTTLIADFDHLPAEIKQKLADGIYTIGESKQVDGNLRAVILDENGVRTRDITMKKVVEKAELTDITRSIGIQMQMHQIMNKLTDISDLQEFLVERDRDTSIYVPFLTARDYILRAQRSTDENVIKENLDSASAELTRAMNSLYTDCETSASSLAKIIKKPVFQSTKNRNRFIKYIVEDIQIAHKYIQVFLAILNYNMDYAASCQVAERYKNFVDDIFNKSIDGKPIAQMLQEYYPYTDSNRNCWYMLIKAYRDKEQSVLPESVVVLSIEGA